MKPVDVNFNLPTYLSDNNWFSQYIYNIVIIVYLSYLLMLVGISTFHKFVLIETSWKWLNYRVA